MHLKFRNPRRSQVAPIVVHFKYIIYRMVSVKYKFVIHGKRILWYIFNRSNRTVIVRERKSLVIQKVPLPNGHGSVRSMAFLPNDFN